MSKFHNLFNAKYDILPADKTMKMLLK